MKNSRACEADDTEPHEETKASVRPCPHNIHSLLSDPPFGLGQAASRASSATRLSERRVVDLDSVVHDGFSKTVWARKL